MICGGTPALAAVTIRARGVRPYRCTAAALATTIAAAPSDSGDDEPAVATPPGRDPGRSAPRVASVVDRRGISSTLSSPTGVISASNRPASIAASAR